MSEEINAIKDKRQWEAIDKIEKYDESIFTAFTGFGKTEVASKYIKKHFIDKVIVAVVPRQSLRDQLLKRFASIPNFHCYVINSFTMSESDKIVKECDLLWVDEVHWCLGSGSQYFSTLLDIVKRKKFLGTSATLSLEHRMFLASKDIKIADTVTISEGIRLGIVPSFFMYNLPVLFTDEEKIKYRRFDKLYDSCFKLFDYNFNLAKECTTKISPRWKGYWMDSPQAKLARERGWDGCTLQQAIINYSHNKKIEAGIAQGKKLPVYGKYDKLNEADKFHPEYIRRMANIWMIAMQRRKWLIEQADNKIPTTVQLLSLIRRKTIVFSSTQKMASDLSTEVNKEKPERCFTYHTKVKRKQDILELFTKSNPDENWILSTVKAADEGIDIKDASLGIQQGYNSNSRVYIQRCGRLLRIDELNPNKITLFINLYVDDYLLYGELVKSQEKKWLMKAQQGQLNVKWFDTVEELKEEIYEQLQ